MTSGEKSFAAVSKDATDARTGNVHPFDRLHTCHHVLQFQIEIYKGDPNII